MPFNTFGVATAVTPSVIETYFSHYLNRRPLKQKPTAHISYHEGLKLIRQFLDYSAKHTIEDLQSFTAQWVPAPVWVRIQDVEIPPQFLTRAANVLRKQLGPNGIEKVGGEKWWQWRRPESPLHAEWIEMKKDYNERKELGRKCERCILYIHGGAYYFGSVDEHRYQMQRHARKLKARVLSPRYRLAPQFPFPCGLYDCIAAYFYLLEHFDPTQILFAGDSAGGGMVLSLLVILRDQGCALPAGVMLLSPWVDLTHSFPSTSGDGAGDYIPPHGFHHKPSMAWPPPSQPEEKAIKLDRKFTQPVEQLFDIVELPASMDPLPISSKLSKNDLRTAAAEQPKGPPPNLNQLPGYGHRLEVEIDKKTVRVTEQFQMYTKNELLTHPLVSPVQQPSLGGLPPMLIQVGGGELLRDEQIYIAHKAAHPMAYLPSGAVLNEHDPQRIIVNQYPPTDVQLQVWEDLCHVPHTLSFTRPAKYMYRSVAQFGAWALARAQHKSIEILDDDAISVISDESDQEFETEGGDAAGADRKSQYGSIGIDGVTSSQFKLNPTGAIGKAGDELPPFKDHMIRQRVNRHGVIFPLPRRSDIASLQLDPSTIGTLKPGPVKKWLAKRRENEQKFSSEYKKLIKKRAKEAKDGYDRLEEREFPPPTALVLRRRRGVAPEEKKKSKSWGLAMWSGWGSSHDESTIQREEDMLNERAMEEEMELAERTGSIAPSAYSRADSTSATKANTETALEAAGLAGLTGGSRKEEKKDAYNEPNDKRRRSSASVLASHWKKGGDDGPYRRVKDAGQARSNSINSASSPIAGSDAGNGLHARNESRRSSVASGKRPASVNQGQYAQSPTLWNAVPTTSDTSKGQDAKVVGTENTFLNPDSSRPHNGTVAYPFKLRQAVGRPSPNPSTMTLESIAQSDKESADANSNVESVAVDAAPANADGVGVEYTPGNQGPETRAPAEPATSPETVRVMVSQPEGSPAQPEFLPAGRRVSLLPHNTASTHAHLRSPPEDPVSPISPVSPIDLSPTTIDTSYLYRPRQGKFESRDSRLGFLGADGMPISAWQESPQEHRSMPAAGESAPKAAPFKIRNPVFDARAGTTQAPPATVPEQQVAAATDATKPAPFKMRHAVYDSKVAPPSSKAPMGKLPAIPGSSSRQEGGAEASKPGNKEVTPLSFNYSSAPSTKLEESTITPDESPIDGGFSFGFQKANNTIPTAASNPAGPVNPYLFSDDPPAPPPKDDAHSSSGKKAITATSKYSATSSSPTDTTAPTIGDLSFETAMDRPTLETFVTASEGLDLKNVRDYKS